MRQRECVTLVLFLERVVAVGILDPPDRISGVLAKAPFDVMQVSGVNASPGRVELKRAAGNVRVTPLSLQRAAEA